MDSKVLTAFKIGPVDVKLSVEGGKLVVESKHDTKFVDTEAKVTVEGKQALDALKVLIPGHVDDVVIALIEQGLDLD